MKLFTPVKIGPFTLSHRVVMAPLTRLRSEQPGDIPGDLMVEHYRQRASKGGLIIIESAAISKRSRAYHGAPGLYSDEQIPGFRKIVDAIHAKGGLVFAQINHHGRTSHLAMSEGTTPVAPSVVPFEQVAFTPDGWLPVSPHRALKIDEIHAITEDFRKATERAFAAGVDGVEIHSANGYLLDQFLQDGTNHRTDEYGGSVENRARFLFEVLIAAASVRGADRIGVRLAPSGQFNSMADSNPEAIFGYVAERLNELGLAYLHIIESRIRGDETKAGEEQAEPVASAQLRKIDQGTILSAGGFTRESAEAILQKGDADLVAFGRHFASNPDLPERLERNLPLNDYNRDAFWGGDHRGYNDYPSYQEPALA
jgi:N-ethylmaleimide reductase